MNINSKKFQRLYKEVREEIYLDHHSIDDLIKLLQEKSRDIVEASLTSSYEYDDRVFYIKGYKLRSLEELRDYDDMIERDKQAAQIRKEFEIEKERKLYEQLKKKFEGHSQ